VVKQAIRTAFPPVRYNGDITSCACGECTHIDEQLRGKTWEEVSPEFLDFQVSSGLILEP
jgi:hypothetical protein